MFFFVSFNSIPDIILICISKNLPDLEQLDILGSYNVSAQAIDK